MKFLLSLVGWAIFAVSFGRLHADNLINVESLGITVDGKQSATKVIQAALDAGKKHLEFPPGDYLIGSLHLPAGTILKSYSGTRFHIDVANIYDRKWVSIEGNDVLIDGGSFVFSQNDGTEVGAQDLASVIFAKGRSNLKVTAISASRQTDGFLLHGPTPEAESRVLVVVTLDNCEDITVSHCVSSRVFALVDGHYSRRINVCDNKATNGEYLDSLNLGCEWITHTGNWSSHVNYQLQWWGGDSDDTPSTHPWVARNSASIIKRGLREGSPGFTKDTVGVFDVIVTDNYAEYGIAAYWGSKGREIIISNNISRYMMDVAFDTEGGEKVIISNNISINSANFDYSCFFHGENLLFTGNIACVEPGDDDKYQGGFLRMQSGDADHFGTSHVLIEGNIFTSKMNDKPRSVAVEGSHDVVIANNKFVNGFVAVADPARSVAITGNDFHFDLDGNYSAVAIASAAGQIAIRNNQFFRPDSERKPTPTDAAISNLFGAGERRIVEANMIEGWSNPFDLSSPVAGSKTQIVLLRNTVTGTVAIAKGGVASQILLMDNFNLTTEKKIALEGAHDPSGP